MTSESSKIGRRSVLKSALLAAIPAAAARATTTASRPARSKRAFTMDLTPGAIGVNVPLPRLIDLAAANGFESIAPDAGALSKLDPAGIEALQATLRSKGLVWGAAGLPVDFRGDDDTFRKGLSALPAQSKTLQTAGVTRVGTWLSPAHKTLTYRANFERHTTRLREVATILGDHGLRFGLEYVGPKTSWSAARYPFIHTLAETRELIAAIDRKNVGLVLDSWHWYTAGESGDDIKTLTNADVVACDLNDAPSGIPVDQQKDLTRALPASTGVIDVKTFLEALVAIGYDGPVRAEPFDNVLNALPPEESVARAAAAMKAAFALIS
jgi:sugar phosphate isomerase/epimerase